MKRKFALAAMGVLLAVITVYSNHFQNGFHFDDRYSVNANPAIRRVANIPSFFADASTFSILPQGYTYRPVVTASLAIDYWLGGGLAPFYFHFTTFIIYLAGLAAMCWLFFKVYEGSIPHPWNPFLALFGAALFGLHPASAETVNYIIQRGDLYATWGIVGGVAMYAGMPKWRRFGLYLIPAAIGILAKPTALVFGPILLAYILLCERRDEEPILRGSKQAIPALALSLCGGLLHKIMTPASFDAHPGSAQDFWMTQPWVALRFFRSFFAPFYLSADTDLTAFTSLNVRAISGMLFLALLIALAVVTARLYRWRPVSFGIWWFLIALLPAAVFPVADVENDHRMFMPFVGLALGAVWTARLLLSALWIDAPAPPRRGVVALAGCAAVALLAALGFGAHVRNEVWRSDESLWYDVTVKSPGNFRGLLNYANSEILLGKFQNAYDVLLRAGQIRDNANLEAYLGTTTAALGRNDEAEEHFRLSVHSGDNFVACLSYAKWLEKQSRWKEALENYGRATSLAPADLEPRLAVMRLYRAQMDFDNLAKAVEEARQIAPEDPGVARYSEIARKRPDDVKLAEQGASATPTAEKYLALSYVYCTKGRLEDCLRAARQAIKVRPNYAEAYNNIAGAYGSMGRRDEGIAAAREALRLKPDYKAARENLMKLQSMQSAGR